MSHLASLERLILVIWIGSMWSIGYVVAPTLFSSLQDRSLAGSIAGQLFTIVSYLGLLCAALLVVFEFKFANALSQPTHRLRFALLVLMLVLICIGQFLLQPMMAAVKSGQSPALALSFGQLHAIASVVFLCNSIAGLALVWFKPRI